MKTAHPAPDSPIERALDQRNAGDLQGAIATMRVAVQGALHDLHLAVTLAQLLAEDDQLEPAERWFRHALELAPDHAQPCLGYGTFLGQCGRLDEARRFLARARELARARLDALDLYPTDDLGHPWSHLGHAECGLARAALESGDHPLARQLLRPWLVDAELWGYAHDIFADIIELDDLDPTTIAQEGLASGDISPFMVCHLLERALCTPPIDFPAVDQLIARANELLHFEWRECAPEIVEVLTSARRLFAHAVMRGEVDPAACPTISSMLPRPRARKARPAGKKLRLVRRRGPG